MIIVKDKISRAELRQIAKKMFGNLVKAVVDVEKGVMAVDGELHADEEALLLREGSRQEDLWGVNLYPEERGENFVEFDSVINVRPLHRNPSCGVESQKIREKIVMIVNRLVEG